MGVCGIPPAGDEGKRGGGDGGPEGGPVRSLDTALEGCADGATAGTAEVREAHSAVASTANADFDSILTMF